MKQLTTRRANLVHLAGWLVIEDARAIPLNGHSAVSITGYIHTQKPASADVPPVDDSYPVLFVGAPAAIVLEWARVRPNRPIKMAVSGRLYRKSGRCVVRAQYVDVLEVETGPLEDKTTRPMPRR